MTGAHNSIIPFPHVTALVEGTVVARVGRIGAYVRHIAHTIDVICVGCGDAVARRRIQPVAVRITARTNRLVIRRLIPLVLGGDGEDRPAAGVSHICIIPAPASHGVVTDLVSGKRVSTRLGRAIVLRPRWLPVRQPVAEARRIPVGNEVHRLIAKAALHAVSVAPARAGTVDAPIYAGVHFRVVE